MRIACAGLLLLTLAACATSTQKFDDSLPGAAGFLYTRIDHDNVTAESLINPSVVNPTPQPKGTTSVLIGYKRIYDSRADRTRTYKTEARRGDNGVTTLVVTDFETNEIVQTVRMPEGSSGGTAAGGGDVNACINAFLCANSSALQCEANRTCLGQPWSLLCPISDTLSVSVHGVIRPNSLRCQVIGPITDFEAVVFTR